MITLQKIALRRGTSLLLKDVNLTVCKQQRIGLIGNNGSGKSSLLALLLGELTPDAGDVIIPKKLKIAHVAQETPSAEISALDYILGGDSQLSELQESLAHAESNNDGPKIAYLHTRLSEIDAYTAKARAGQLLHGLGFKHTQQLKRVKEFSGGWRVRLNLARALMAPADLLLLDEPTNHLDLDAIVWLEQWLEHYKGTLILISHDRDFLDHVVNHIIHLHDQTLTLYSGNYTSFEKRRAEILSLQEANYSKQQRKIAHLQDFISRFKAKASKARQAQSRIKALERMAMVSAVQNETNFQFRFKAVDKCANPLLSLENASIAYNEKCILKNLNLNINAEERIAFIGPNGAGKSSLIKLLANVIPPHEGTRVQSSGLKIGYFAQHQIDYLQLEASPLRHLQELSPQIKQEVLRTYLGGFGFSSTRVLEPVKNFSGGEKSRLALALIIFQKPNLLLLDEPTNHLDLAMREALSLALQEYEGAMVLVSHDRFLIRNSVDQLILVANQGITLYDGDLNDYERWLCDYRRRNNADIKASYSTSTAIPNKPPREIQPSTHKTKRALIQTIKKLEVTIEKLQVELVCIENQLADSSLYMEGKIPELKEILAGQDVIKHKVQQYESAWLKACEELELLNQNKQ